MSRKIILIKQELLLLVYELNRSGLLAENEKIRPILAQLRSEERFSRNAETEIVCRLLLEKKKLFIKLDACSYALNRQHRYETIHFHWTMSKDLKAVETTKFTKY